jgi:hypothetical protein
VGVSPPLRLWLAPSGPRLASRLALIHRSGRAIEQTAASASSPSTLTWVE